MVYNFVIKNRDKVMYMTIRELADAAGVSTTTVLRFCRKLNCEGYSEFRVRFKLYLEQNEPQQANFGASEIISFFKGVNNEEFDALLDDAINIILSSERIIFVGAGTSGSLAKYGARFFSNVGRHGNDGPAARDPALPYRQRRNWRSLWLARDVSTRSGQYRNRRRGDVGHPTALCKSLYAQLPGVNALDGASVAPLPGTASCRAGSGVPLYRL
jgi:AcrR family transcriptional regulator